MDAMLTLALTEQPSNSLRESCPSCHYTTHGLLGPSLCSPHALYPALALPVTSHVQASDTADICIARRAACLHACFPPDVTVDPLHARHENIGCEGVAKELCHSCLWVC